MHISHEVEEVFEEALHEITEVFTEEELISHSHHKKLEKIILVLRNSAVLVALLLFVASLFHFEGYNIIKSVAYFVGAFAYVCEILLLTDCLTTKVPHSEMFMAYCFGPLYILMGLGYLL